MKTMFHLKNAILNAMEKSPGWDEDGTISLTITHVSPDGNEVVVNLMPCPIMEWLKDEEISNV